MADSKTKIKYDPHSDVPAVRQIAGNLRVLLVEGRLRAGDSIPSVRRLAMELGVHFNTVAEAYRDLAAEGWLDLRHGRPAVITERQQPPAVDRKWVDDFRGRLRTLIAELRTAGVPSIELAAELAKMAEKVKQL